MTTSNSMPAHIAVTRAIPGELFIPNAQIRVLGTSAAKQQELHEFVRGAHVIISMFHDQIDAKLLDAAGPQLKGVCNVAVGFNNIDLKACKERGIRVTNTPDAVTEGTADLAWALLLAVARQLVAADKFVRTGQWERQGILGMGEWLGQDLTGRTLLIVGAGRIGLAVAQRSLAWGMRVLYVARSTKWPFELAPVAAERVDLQEGLARADAVSLHVPLTDETRHLIGAHELNRMKPTSILINTSRGPVVDEAALVKALQNKRLWGAGLDVFEREPALHPGLAELDNVVLTPHIGSAERRFREAMTAMASANAQAILAGNTPPNLVQ